MGPNSFVDIVILWNKAINTIELLMASGILHPSFEKMSCLKRQVKNKKNRAFSTLYHFEDLLKWSETHFQAPCQWELEG